ncbi:alginate lyase family protein [Pontibacter populi]|uniref:Alginate lyase family protein n=1 Tax=Pontibacter populi TaxID=890055 RepID=A0ABV1RVS2_9BACT
MGKVSLLFNTVKHLKVKQIIYQVAYRVFKIKPLAAYKSSLPIKQPQFLSFSDFLPDATYATENGEFLFLNQKVSFKEKIDWDYMGNGKLWNYNLHYANYLLQEGIPLATKLTWLSDLHNALYSSNKGLEPYPVSLRIMNTIRLISRHKLNVTDILDALAAEVNFLSGRVEYHLLGNHVLENGFALLMGGAFFQKENWIERGHEILKKELKEQILSDGAHFELSPMYHQIILYRVLELIDWYSNWTGGNRNQLNFYRATASNMLSWLDQMTFRNGDIPHFNDSANGITYTSSELSAYAGHLNIKPEQHLSLDESGYRKFSTDKYECVVDVAAVGPTYQPGHAHSDALAFILYVHDTPLLVERGTSTYQPDKQRAFERSTAAHNTVTLNNHNQSEVWGGFRVGDRAVVNVLTDEDSRLEAEHDGYMKFGVICKRSFIFEKNKLTIKDSFRGKLGAADSLFAYFHLHPEVNFVKEDDTTYYANGTEMKFSGATDLSIDKYEFSEGFNKRREGQVICVKFLNTLETIISF